jgi:hypothetical protein
MYHIFRNGVEVGQTGIGIYQDTGLAAGTSYTYKIRADDGFHTGDSIDLVVTTDAAPAATPTPTPPAPPSGSSGSTTPTMPAKTNDTPTTTTPTVTAPTTGAAPVATDTTKSPATPIKQAATGLSAATMLSQPWWIIGLGLILAACVVVGGKVLAKRNKPPQPVVPPAIDAPESAADIDLKL